MKISVQKDKDMDRKKHRQYQLHGILKNNRYPVTVEHLAEQLDTSSKTLYRDFQEFRDLYRAPLLLEEGRVSYDKTQKLSFELPGIWFSDTELQSLLVAQQLLSQIQPGVIEEQIKPIKALVVEMLSRHGHTAIESLHRIRILGIGQRTNHPQHFSIIAEAVLDRKRCYLEYIDRHSEQLSKRVISPQRLTHYRYNWYLDAWCHDKEGLRTFSLDSVHSINILEKTALDVDESLLKEQLESAFGIFSGKADRLAKLAFIGSRAKYVSNEQWHPEQRGEWQGEKYILEIPYHNPTELIMDILKYGADVSVLGPVELRDEVKQMINSMKRLYE